MALATRELRSGLVIAEEAVDEARLQRALKAMNDRLVLQKERNDAAPGGWAYRVFLIVADDQPPVPIISWTDDYGNWLPLSSGLLDKVDRHRRDGRVAHIDADERNRRLVEETRAGARAAQDSISDDHRAGIERGRVTVGLSTKPVRPYWQRRLRGGYVDGVT